MPGADEIVPRRFMFDPDTRLVDPSVRKGAVMASKLTAHADVSIDATPDTVWRGLTDSDLVGKAFFDTRVESDWREGSPITISGEWQGKAFQDKGEVVSVVPYEQLVYTHWSPLSGTADEPANYHTITLRLTPRDDGTRLALSQDNVADEDELRHSEDNWSVMLENLKKLIEQRS
jgi:uncharacterized protein YndB with AHSA1/START domain